MSNFPNQIDDDTTLPPVNDNITDDGGTAINATRDAIFNIETNIGTSAAGSVGSISTRLAASLNPDGTIKPSAINSLSLDYTQIKIGKAQVLPCAGIQESKLALNYPTANLFNYTQDLARSVNIALNWIDITGVKLEPHLSGALYRHQLSDIDVSSFPNNFLLNRFGLLRNNTNSYTVINDLNSDYVAHQVSDGTVTGSFPTVTTPSGLKYPSSFAHSGSGIFIDTSIFSIIPQTANNLQLFAEFVDNANTLLLGTKTQTLFQSGISRSARATAIGSNSKGPTVVPSTSATTFVSTTTPLDSPFPNPTYGDDIILFTPTVGVSNFVFQSYLNSVKPGDIATVNYGNVVTAFLVKEVNPLQFTIRIAGKNVIGTTSATVDISKSLDTRNKYGVLAPAIAPSPSSSLPSSLIIGSPRGAEATGIGFNASMFDIAHYNLYLQLYPDGNPSDLIVSLPAIDVTGNQGITPGAYTLDSIVQSANTAIRKAGYNFRFIAFEFGGEFGIMLADSYNKASFSVISGVQAISGGYNPTLTNTLYPNNVVDVINNIDPLGFGLSGANLASPPFSSGGFISQAASLIPTVVIPPLQRSFYYINGGESDRFAVQAGQLLDANGDPYWPATIISKSITGSTIQVTYQVNENLTSTNLQLGKTIVVQPQTFGTGLLSDFGRFTIQNVIFNSTCTVDGYVYSTNITVYDAVHGIGTSPYLTSGIGFPVNLYFGYDSVGFNTENANDILGQTNTEPFNKHFEVYVDQDGSTFSYERARFSLSNSTTNPGFLVNNIEFYVGKSNNFNNFNIVDISPKLTGYTFTNAIGSSITKINLQITSYNSTTGIYQGYLRRLDPGLAESFTGPITTGKNGEVTRFYDATYVDYIDLELDFGIALIVPGDNYGMDIQVYPSLRLHDELMLLATCQYNDSSNQITYLEDRRQFGNTSEKQFSDSAIDFIDATARNTQQNGIVRGFDYLSTLNNTVSFRGGLALVNGRFLAINPFDVDLPIVQDFNGGTPVAGVLFAICINTNSEVVLLPLTDFNASVNAINNPGRLLELHSLATLQNYNVDSSTFSTVINDRKDLTVLWLATMSASSTLSYTITVQDARKYVTDSSANNYMVVTGGDSQGNFKSFSSASTWSYYNSTYQNQMVVRGNSVFSSDPGLTFSAILTGDGNSSLTFNFASTISNITLNNLTLNINQPLTVVDCTFNNCVINFGFGAAGSIDPSVFNDCTINLAQSITVSAATFNNCTIRVGYNGLVNVATTIAAGIILAGSANGVIFSKCNFTYYPNTTTNYSATNMINSGNGIPSGAIYSSVVSLKNITVDGCQFTTNTSTRFPFISLEYNLPSSIAQSIYVTGNKFFNTSNINDMYSVIAITSTIIVPQPTEGLKLIDCRIKDNICDKDQMISIAGRPDLSNNIESSIVPVGTIISGNSCGTISVLGAADNERNYEINTDNYGYDKNYGVNISSNTCKYIGSLSSIGSTFFGADIGTFTFNTCSMLVDKNTCAWIHLVGNAVNNTTPNNQNSTLFVSNNSVRSYNTAVFFNAFQENTAYNVGIMTAVAGTSGPIQAIITGNTVTQGSYLNSSNTVVTYDYANSLDLRCNSIVSNNIFNNIAASGDMITVHNYLQLNVNINNNQFYRNATSINSYINLGAGNFPNIISDNFFDHPNVDGSNTTLIAGATTNSTITKNMGGLNTGYLEIVPAVSRYIYQPMSAYFQVAGSCDGFNAKDGNGGAGQVTIMYITKFPSGCQLNSLNVRWYISSTGPYAWTTTPVINLANFNNSYGASLTIIPTTVTGNPTPSGSFFGEATITPTSPLTLVDGTTYLIYITGPVWSSGANTFNWNSPKISITVTQTGPGNI